MYKARCTDKRLGLQGNYSLDLGLAFQLIELPDGDLLALKVIVSSSDPRRIHREIDCLDSLRYTHQGTQA